MMDAEEKEFKELLNTLRKRIAEHRTTYEKNEAAVKRHLIEPVLSFFKWEMENLLQVVPEYSTESGRADYCLMIENENKRGLFLEAKPMSKSPGKEASQLSRYCYDEGVLYGVISNGKQWLLVRSFEENISARKRRLWEVDIVDDSDEKIYAKLSQISRENLPELDARVREAETVEGLIDRVLQTLAPQVVSGLSEAVKSQPEFASLSCTSKELDMQVRARLSYIFHGVDRQETVFEPKEKTNQDSYADSKTDLDDFRKEYDLEIDGYPSTAAVGRPAPKGIRKRAAPQRPEAITLFGKTIRLEHTYDILTTVGNELIRRKALSAKDVPISAGYSRFLVHSTPKHPTGKAFEQSKPLLRHLWMETCYGTKDAIRQAKKLLEHCGYDGESDLQIIWK